VNGPSISVIIPVFNEEREIGPVLAEVRAWLQEHAGEWEVLVVDNASTDGTAEAAAPQLDGERMRLLRNERNRGKGYSIRRGMLEARGDLRLMCDADCAPSLASLERMVQRSEEADVVVGSRVATGARVERHQPLQRRVVGLGILTLCHVLMREPARDIFCGFKLFRAEAAEAVFSRVRLEGWTFDVEALGLARALGYRVQECGIVWINRPSSRLSISRTLAPTVRELLAARRHVREQAAAARAGEARVPERVETGV
jgi:dolichyl-phosphate beta-glucosyltransferase